MQISGLRLFSCSHFKPQDLEVLVVGRFACSCIKLLIMALFPEVNHASRT